MTYPITTSGPLRAGETLDLTFRPAAAGLVSVVANVIGQPPPRDPAGDASQAPPLFAISLHIEVFKPGSTAPAVSNDGGRTITPPQIPRLVVAAETPAAEPDLGADWVARVTNTGDGLADCTVTARYQVLAGNLGKIDHILVLMMENRSFDHMLGYLHLQGTRPDVDGLTGAEANKDETGSDVPVHLLATDGRARPTYFASDPAHGWPDVVAQQLVANASESNTGFVLNFARKLKDEADGLAPLLNTVHDEGWIQAGESRVLRFRPGQPGPVTALSQPRGAVHSEAGDLAELALRFPGSSEPLATTLARVGDTSLGLSHDATDADLAVAGDWTCEVTNTSDGQLHFSTEVTYVVMTHDTRGQEPAAAIMGYYNADQLPVYDRLAAEFAICNRWFASLPTDTWPNRLYSITGGSGGVITTPGPDQITSSDPPGFTLKTIFEVLQERGIDWGIYFSDMPFPLVFKHLAQDAQYTWRMRSIRDLTTLAETGDLPSVAWIEPNYNDVEEPLGQPEAANDDHPPGDVTAGQKLVRQIYNTLCTSPAWSKTLLIITYDEHGGFYDHVRPPGTPPLPDPPDGPPDDIPDLRRYGVRVPTLVVSPWVVRGSASNAVYDHTSILATILRRFCADPLPSMGQRTDKALNVGAMLAGDAPRAAPFITVTPTPVSCPLQPVAKTAFGVVLRNALVGF